MGSAFGFGGDSTSQAFDNRQSATDQGRTVRQSNKYTESGAISVNGDRSKYQAEGSADLSGNKGQIGGLSVNSKGAVTVTTADPAVAMAAIQSNNNALSKFLETSGQQTASAYSGATDLLTKFLDQSGAIAQAGQTGGASVAAKSLAWILLGGLGIAAAAVVAVFFFRSK